MENSIPPQQTVVKGKVVFVGDAGVGKTSIINFYNKITGETQSTVGANSITCVVPFQDHDITLNVWDTAGQENFQCLVPMFARCAQVAIIVYDVSSVQSFENIDIWYNQMKENSQVPHIIICANKSDLPTDINADMINKLKERIDCPIYRTSAVTGSGIDILFTAIGEIVDESNYVENQAVLPHVDFVNPVDQTNHHSKKCC